MPKFLIRIVAFLLVPCLAGDALIPACAATFGKQEAALIVDPVTVSIGTAIRISGLPLQLFASQALAPQIINTTHPNVGEGVKAGIDETLGQIILPPAAPATPQNPDTGQLAQMLNPAQGAGESTNRVSDVIIGASFLMAAGLTLVKSWHQPAHLLSSLMCAIPLIGMALIDRRGFFSRWFKHDDIPPRLSAILESMGLSLETLPAALNSRPEIRQQLMDRVVAHLRKHPEDLADVQRFVADSPSRSVVLAETVNRREIGQEMLSRLLRPAIMPVLPGPPLPNGDSDIQAAPTTGPLFPPITRRLFLQASAASVIRPTPGKQIVASAFRDPFEFLSSLPFIFSNPTLFDLMAGLFYDVPDAQSAGELSLSVEQAIAHLISGKANQRLSLRLLWEIEYGLFEVASAFVQWGIPIISTTPELNPLSESSPLVQAPKRIPPLASAWKALDLDGLNAVRGLMDPWDRLWADLKRERRVPDRELQRNLMLDQQLTQVVVDRYDEHLKTMGTQLAQHPWMQKQMSQLEAIRATRRSDLLPGMLQGGFPINAPEKEVYAILYQLQDLYRLQSRFTVFRRLLEVTSTPELALDGSRLLSRLIKQGPGFLHDPEWEHWYSLSRDFWSSVMPDTLMLQEPPSTPGDRAISIDRQMRREGLRLTLPPIKRAWSELMNGRAWMMGPSHHFRFLRHGISALRSGKDRYDGWRVDQFDLTHPELPTAPLSTNRLIREAEKRSSPDALAEPARAAIAEPGGSSDSRQPPIADVADLRRLPEGKSPSGNIPMSDSPPVVQAPAASMSTKSLGPRPYTNPQLRPPSLKLGPAADPAAPASTNNNLLKLSPEEVTRRLTSKEVIPFKRWLSLQRHLRGGSIVALQNGSGFAFAEDDTYSYVMTNSHVVGVDPLVMLKRFGPDSSEEVMGKVILRQKRPWRSRLDRANLDIAIIAFAKSDLEATGIRLSPLSLPNTDDIVGRYVGMISGYHADKKDRAVSIVAEVVGTGLRTFALPGKPASAYRKPGDSGDPLISNDQSGAPVAMAVFGRTMAIFPDAGIAVSLMPASRQKLIGYIEEVLSVSQIAQDVVFATENLDLLQKALPVLIKVFQPSAPPAAPATPPVTVPKRRAASLSARERHVLSRVGLGWTNKEIAGEEPRIEEGSVKAIIRRMAKKLKMTRSDTEKGGGRLRFRLIQYAHQSKILPDLERQNPGLLDALKACASKTFSLIEADIFELMKDNLSGAAIARRLSKNSVSAIKFHKIQMQARLDGDDTIQDNRGDYRITPLVAAALLDYYRNPRKRRGLSQTQTLRAA